jgi:hypothetical protein
MTKKHIFKKQIRSIKKERILWVAIIILAALLASSIWYIIKTSSSDTSSSTNLNRPTMTKAQEEHLQAFVNDIEQRRYRYPVIDVKENRVYIPEAHMYLPLNESSRDIRYQVLGDTIWLSTAMAVGRQTGNEDASCDRVVIVTDSENKAGGYIAAGTIKSSDGSTRFVFRHPACEIYGDESSKRLADVVMETQYY